MQLKMEVDENSATGEDGASTQVLNIPFELVDDDEMAAIECALLHADSVSSAYHKASVLTSAKFGRPYASIDCSTANHSNDTFMYSVSSPTTSALCGAVNAISTVGCSTDSEQQNGSFSTARNGLSPGSPERSASPSLGDSDRAVLKRPLSVAATDESFIRRTFPQNVSQASSESSCAVLTEGLSVASANSAVLADALIQGQTSGELQDVEDLGGVSRRASSLNANSKGKEKAVVTLLQRKSGRGLAVTDFTASEWCEKQVEFSLNRGKPARTPAMKAGSVRHVELEKEVVTRVDIEIHTKEDTWAVRLLNFIGGARQLLSEGLTRELPVLGIVDGTWVVGIIDEIRLVENEGKELPLLVDTKTRRRRRPPSEPQKRNSRLQLMCYKMLWDSMVETWLPAEAFFKHFRLNPQQRFCEDVKSHLATFWDTCEVQCLQDLMPHIMDEVICKIYPKSGEALLLRYEWQEDQSLLGEDEFIYEHEWLMDRWHWHLEFWNGQRAADVVPAEESWKCSYCSFANVCLPAQQPPLEDVPGHGQ